MWRLTGFNLNSGIKTVVSHRVQLSSFRLCRGSVDKNQIVCERNVASLQNDAACASTATLHSVTPSSHWPHLSHLAGVMLFYYVVNPCDFGVRLRLCPSCRYPFASTVSCFKSVSYYFWLCCAAYRSPLHRVFYFENWLDPQCQRAVWLPVWLYLLCAARRRCGPLLPRRDL